MAADLAIEVVDAARAAWSLEWEDRSAPVSSGPQAHGGRAQSRSSCMAAHALAPSPGGHAVDCCAAPGNKTTHLAALLGPGGRVDAFEKDGKRAAHLQTNLEACGAGAVTVHQVPLPTLKP